MISLYQKSYSEFLELFFGIQVWTTRVVKNGIPQEPDIENMNPDPFMSLDMWLTPQSTAISMAACMSKNLEPERIEGFVDAEGNPKERILRFWSLPRVLMVNIKRYTPTGQKIRTPVTPDYDIDLSSYVIGYDSSRGVKHEYELFGAAVHSGEHPRRALLCPLSNAKWYEFNDSKWFKTEFPDAEYAPRRCVLLLLQEKIRFQYIATNASMEVNINQYQEFRRVIQLR